MNLSDVKIVDLKHSKWNKTSSNVKKGIYDFQEKVFVDYGDKGRRPDFFLTTVRYEPSNGYREYRDAKVKEGASFILASEEQFFPEGAELDSEGKYVFGDAVFVKIPLINELRRRAAAREMATKGARAKIDQFKGQMKREASDIPDSLIDEMIDSQTS